MSMQQMIPAIWHRLLLPLALLLALATAACESAPRRQVFPEITFSHRQPLVLDVAEIRLEEAYRPPLQLPNVEHLIPVAPTTVMQRWAKDRLRPGGSSGTATVSIREASVVEQPLQTMRGLKGAFTTEQEARYEATLSVRIDVETAGGLGTGFVEATATRSRTVPENMTLNDRDRLFFEMVEGLGRDIDEALEARIRQHLRPFLL